MSHALTSEGHDASEDGTGRGTPLHYYVEDFEDGTLTSSMGRIDRHPLLVDSGVERVSRERDASLVAAGAAAPDVAAPLSHGSNPNSNAAGRRREDDENLVALHITQDPIHHHHHHHALGDGTAGVMEGAVVRRLTPTECERLQGLPDGWTDIEYDGKPAADSRRYAALGDAVTATAAHWIGDRLMRDALTPPERSL